VICSYYGQTATVATLTIAVATTVTNWDWYFSSPKGPEYGWYREFDPWPDLLPWRLPLIGQRPHRAQARGCIKTDRRWKRRRFLHSLRRAV
jgi:hypothetical protein